MLRKKKEKNAQKEKETKYTRALRKIYPCSPSKCKEEDHKKRVTIPLPYPHTHVHLDHNFMISSLLVSGYNICDARMSFLFPILSSTLALLKVGKEKGKLNALIWNHTH